MPSAWHCTRRWRHREGREEFELRTLRQLALNGVDPDEPDRNLPVDRLPAHLRELAIDPLTELVELILGQWGIDESALRDRLAELSDIPAGSLTVDRQPDLGARVGEALTAISRVVSDDADRERAAGLTGLVADLLLAGTVWAGGQPLLPHALLDWVLARLAVDPAGVLSYLGYPGGDALTVPQEPFPQRLTRWGLRQEQRPRRDDAAAGSSPQDRAVAPLEQRSSKAPVVAPIPVHLPAGNLVYVPYEALSLRTAVLDWRLAMAALRDYGLHAWLDPDAAWREAEAGGLIMPAVAVLRLGWDADGLLAQDGDAVAAPADEGVRRFDFIYFGDSATVLVQSKYLNHLTIESVSAGPGQPWRAPDEFVAAFEEQLAKRNREDLASRHAAFAGGAASDGGDVVGAVDDGGVPASALFEHRFADGLGRPGGVVGRSFAAGLETRPGSRVTYLPSGTPDEAWAGREVEFVRKVAAGVAGHHVVLVHGAGNGVLVDGRWLSAVRFGIEFRELVGWDGRSPVLFVSCRGEVLAVSSEFFQRFAAAAGVDVIAANSLVAQQGGRVAAVVPEFPSELDQPILYQTSRAASWWKYFHDYRDRQRLTQNEIDDLFGVTARPGVPLPAQDTHVWAGTSGGGGRSLSKYQQTWTDSNPAANLKNTFTFKSKVNANGRLTNRLGHEKLQLVGRGFVPEGGDVEVTIGTDAAGRYVAVVDSLEQRVDRRGRPYRYAQLRNPPTNDFVDQYRPDANGRPGGRQPRGWHQENWTADDPTRNLVNTFTFGAKVSDGHLSNRLGHEGFPGVGAGFVPDGSAVRVTIGFDPDAGRNVVVVDGLEQRVDGRGQTYQYYKLPDPPTDEFVNQYGPDADRRPRVHHQENWTAHNPAANLVDTFTFGAKVNADGHLSNRLGHETNPGVGKGFVPGGGDVRVTIGTDAASRHFAVVDSLEQRIDPRGRPYQYYQLPDPLTDAFVDHYRSDAYGGPRVGASMQQRKWTAHDPARNLVDTFTFGATVSATGQLSSRLGLESNPVVGRGFVPGGGAVVVTIGFDPDAGRYVAVVDGLGQRIDRWGRPYRYVQLADPPTDEFVNLNRPDADGAPSVSSQDEYGSGSGSEGASTASVRDVDVDVMGQVDSGSELSDVDLAKIADLLEEDLQRGWDDDDVVDWFVVPGVDGDGEVEDVHVGAGGQVRVAGVGWEGEWVGPGGWHVVGGVGLYRPASGWLFTLAGRFDKIGGDRAKVLSGVMDPTPWRLVRTDQGVEAGPLSVGLGYVTDKMLLEGGAGSSFTREDLDQARTRFTPVSGGAAVLLRHRPVPDPRMDDEFSRRDRKSPYYRVADRYATDDGLVHENVHLFESVVDPDFQKYIRDLVRKGDPRFDGWTEAELDGIWAKLIENHRRDKTRLIELGKLPKEQRYTAQPVQRRMMPRKVLEHHLEPQDMGLKNQNSAYLVPPAQPGSAMGTPEWVGTAEVGEGPVADDLRRWPREQLPLLRNGVGLIEVLGVELSPEETAEWEETYGDVFPDYSWELETYESVQRRLQAAAREQTPLPERLMVDLAAEGATNSAGFINTPLDKNGVIEQKRINVEFAGIYDLMSDKYGKRHWQATQMAVALDNAVSDDNPSGHLWAEYGTRYDPILEQLAQASAAAVPIRVKPMVGARGGAPQPAASTRVVVELPAAAPPRYGKWPESSIPVMVDGQPRSVRGFRRPDGLEFVALRRFEDGQWERWWHWDDVEKSWLPGEARAVTADGAGALPGSLGRQAEQAETVTVRGGRLRLEGRGLIGEWHTRHVVGFGPAWAVGVVRLHQRMVEGAVRGWDVFDAGPDEAPRLGRLTLKEDGELSMVWDEGWLGELFWAGPVEETVGADGLITLGRVGVGVGVADGLVRLVRDSARPRAVSVLSAGDDGGQRLVGRVEVAAGQLGAVATGGSLVFHPVVSAPVFDDPELGYLAFGLEVEFRYLEVKLPPDLTYLAFRTALPQPGELTLVTGKFTQLVIDGNKLDMPEIVTVPVPLFGDVAGRPTRAEVYAEVRRMKELLDLVRSGGQEVGKIFAGQLGFNVNPKFASTRIVPKPEVDRQFDFQLSVSTPVMWLGGVIDWAIGRAEVLPPLLKKGRQPTQHAVDARGFGKAAAEHLVASGLDRDHAELMKVFFAALYINMMPKLYGFDDVDLPKGYALVLSRTSMAGIRRALSLDENAEKLLGNHAAVLRDMFMDYFTDKNRDWVEQVAGGDLRTRFFKRTPRYESDSTPNQFFMSAVKSRSKHVGQDDIGIHTHFREAYRAGQLAAVVSEIRDYVFDGRSPLEDFLRVVDELAAFLSARYGQPQNADTAMADAPQDTSAGSAGSVDQPVPAAGGADTPARSGTDKMTWRPPPRTRKRSAGQVGSGDGSDGGSSQRRVTRARRGAKLDRRRDLVIRTTQSMTAAGPAAASPPVGGASPSQASPAGVQEGFGATGWTTDPPIHYAESSTGLDRITRTFTADADGALPPYVTLAGEPVTLAAAAGRPVTLHLSLGDNTNHPPAVATIVDRNGTTWYHTLDSPTPDEYHIIKGPVLSRTGRVAKSGALWVAQRKLGVGIGFKGEPVRVWFTRQIARVQLPGGLRTIRFPKPLTDHEWSRQETRSHGWVSRNLWEGLHAGVSDKGTPLPPFNIHTRVDADGHLPFRVAGKRPVAGKNAAGDAVVVRFGFETDEEGTERFGGAVRKQIPTKPGTEPDFRYRRLEPSAEEYYRLWIRSERGSRSADAAAAEPVQPSAHVVLSADTPLPAGLRSVVQWLDELEKVRGDKAVRLWIAVIANGPLGSNAIADGVIRNELRLVSTTIKWYLSQLDKEGMLSAGQASRGYVYQGQLPRDGMWGDPDFRREFEEAVRTLPPLLRDPMLDLIRRTWGSPALGGSAEPGSGDGSAAGEGASTSSAQPSSASWGGTGTEGAAGMDVEMSDVGSGDWQPTVDGEYASDDRWHSGLPADLVRGVGNGDGNMCLLDSLAQGIEYRSGRRTTRDGLRGLLLANLPRRSQQRVRLRAGRTLDVYDPDTSNLLMEAIEFRLQVFEVSARGVRVHPIRGPQGTPILYLVHQVIISIP